MRPKDMRYVLMREDAFSTLIKVAAKSKGQHPVVVWKEPTTERITYHVPAVYLIPVGEKQP